MEAYGINFGYLLIQLCSLSLFFGWLILAALGLLSLRRSGLPPTAQALWSLILVGVPVLGAAAFFIVRPDRERTEPDA